AVRYGGRVGDKRECGSFERTETEPDEQCGGDGDGSAESGGSFKERSEAERDEDELKPAIPRYVHKALLKNLEESSVAGELVHEDDIENDPADGEETVAGAEDGSLCCHASGHAEHPDGAAKRSDEAEEGGVVRFDVEERECAEEHDHWKRSEDGREPPVAGGIVILRPFVGCGGRGMDFVSEQNCGDSDND